MTDCPTTAADSPVGMPLQVSGEQQQYAHQKCNRLFLKKQRFYRQHMRGFIPTKYRQPLTIFVPTPVLMVVTDAGISPERGG
jgi:hypothetical protein